jgi:hypothetical protein
MKISAFKSIFTAMTDAAEITGFDGITLDIINAMESAGIELDQGRLSARRLGRENGIDESIMDSAALYAADIEAAHTAEQNYESPMLTDERGTFTIIVRPDGSVTRKAVTGINYGAAL